MECWDLEAPSTGAPTSATNNNTGEHEDYAEDTNFMATSVHNNSYYSDSLLVSGQPTGTVSPPPGAGASTASSGVSTGAVSPSGSATGMGSCCENGRPIMTDPVSGHTVCSCQYDSARLALSSYPRLSSGYGTPYPSTDQNPYPSIDSSAFYSPLSNPYGLKDGSPSAEMTAWGSAGLQPSTGYYPYDPTLAAYGYGASYDLAARRKNATRESTATLKAWLNEHKKNPYPTKGEKIMLAIITKMTLTQVSTWFANARRRLKKENKMTWEPKNKTDDDDDTIISGNSDEKDKEDIMMDDEKIKDHRLGKDSMMHVKSEDEDLDDDERKPSGYHHHMLHSHHHTMMMKDEMTKNDECGVPLPATKPRIWSLADTAACKTPPPSQQPWCSAGSSSGFALPASAMSPSAPYSRYGGFWGGMPHGNQGNSGSTGGGGSAFPEVQTDTPPQTPPNMKLPSVIAAPASCFPPGSQNPPHQDVRLSGYQTQNNYFPRHQQQSPHKEYHPSHQGIPPPVQPQQPQQHNEETAFKPFYKSPQQMNGGFVSPV